MSQPSAQALIDLAFISEHGIEDETWRQRLASIPHARAVEIIGTLLSVYAHCTCPEGKALHATTTELESGGSIEFAEFDSSINDGRRMATFSTSMSVSTGTNADETPHQRAPSVFASSIAGRTLMEVPLGMPKRRETQVETDTAAVVDTAPPVSLMNSEIRAPSIVSAAAVVDEVEAEAKKMSVVAPPSRGPSDPIPPVGTSGVAMTVALEDLNFYQDYVSNHFMSGKSLNNTIRDLQNGEISPESLPPIEALYWRGKWYGMGNRRLSCFHYVYRNDPQRRIPVVASILEDDTLLMPQGNGKTVRLGGGLMLGGSYKFQMCHCSLWP